MYRGPLHSRGKPRRGTPKKNDKINGAKCPKCLGILAEEPGNDIRNQVYSQCLEKKKSLTHNNVKRKKGGSLGSNGEGGRSHVSFPGNGDES